MQTVSHNVDAKRSLYQHLTLKSRDEPAFPSRRSSISSSAGSINSDASVATGSTSTPLSIHNTIDNDAYLAQLDENLQTFDFKTNPFLPARVTQVNPHDGFKVPDLALPKQESDFYKDLTLRTVPQPENLQPNPRRTVQPRVKPTLVRQEERRTNYVDHLIDITEQLVAFIWPASRSVVNMPVRTGHSPIDLRFFIREILRRSRSSHSTLQVAMYYCFLVWKSGKMPQTDGRRMFLASLMLAYKYLQDRNFSTHAWKSISNLSTTEIKAIEIVFLKAVDYKLFIAAADWNAWRCTIDLCGSYATKHLPCPWDIVLHNMIDIQKSDDEAVQLAANVKPTELDQLASVACNANSLGLGIMTPPSSPEELETQAAPMILPSKNLSVQDLTPPSSQEPRSVSVPPAPSITPLTSPESDGLPTISNQHWNASTPASPAKFMASSNLATKSETRSIQTVCLVSQVTGDFTAEESDSEQPSWTEDNYELEDELEDEHEEHISRFLDGKSKRTSHIRRKRSIRTSGDENSLRRKIPRCRKA